MTAPTDALRRCDALISEGRIDDARACALALADAPPTGTPKASKLGALLFQLGEFAAAGRVLAAEINARTATPEAQRVLSTLLYRAGDLRGARLLMTEACQRDPYKGLPPAHDQKPVLLRVRALHQSSYGVSKDRVTGLRRRKLLRGHFSTRHFIDTSRFNVVVASLVGSELPPTDSLPRPDLIVNTAACADLNPAGLEDVERFVGQFSDVPIINRPGRVRSTSRAGNAHRLSQIEGVIFPQTVNIRRPQDPAIALDLLRQTGMAYPLILRQAGSQTGRTMELAQNDTDVVRYVAAQEVHQPLVAIKYHDARDAHGRYRKLRAFFIDGKMYPVVDLRSDHWNLHSSDRYRIMHQDNEAQKDELRFLSSPEEVLGVANIERLAEINRQIGLDFLGVDFTPCADGRLLIFEANAAMRHNYDHLELFPYRAPFLDAISDAFRRMLDVRVAGVGETIS